MRSTVLAFVMVNDICSLAEACVAQAVGGCMVPTDQKRPRDFKLTSLVGNGSEGQTKEFSPGWLVQKRKIPSTNRAPWEFEAVITVAVEDCNGDSIAYSRRHSRQARSSFPFQ